MAEIRPFTALRYAADDLADLVAPPYDVISEAARADYLARSPYNVVHLTLPDSEEQAARDLAAWRKSGVLVEEAEPSYWWLAQRYVGPDGIERTREGFVAALRVEPYEKRVVLPHERTHAGPKEGRLRLLRATRTQLEPIFLLWDGTIEVDGLGDPDLAVEEGGVDAKLWRLDPEFGAALTEELKDAQLLIADGHHRYETALAFHEEDGSEASAFMLVVIVPTGQEGLTIFPTHRIAQSVDGCQRHADRSVRPMNCRALSSIDKDSTSCSTRTASTRRSSTGCSRRACRTRRTWTRPSRPSTAATPRPRSSCDRRGSRMCGRSRAAATSCRRRARSSIRS